MTRAVRTYVGLGSNLENPIAQLRRAIESLGSIPKTTFVCCSPLYRSAPLGPPQPDYVNAVAALDTTLASLTFLRELQQIEQRHGRTRGERWGPRTIDLDLLLYGDERSNDPQLTLPHPQMHLRDFVLRPLCDIAADVVIPPYGRACDLLRRSESHDLQAVGES